VTHLRILAFAYACEPGHGSEPGAGWAWARMLARLGETWVITRANNREVIEAEFGRVPERDRLHFVYVDLPPWARWWKRGQRGVRLYYLLWQMAAVRRARRLDRSLNFELVWHLTLANAWLGSLAPMVGRRFVYGPVGGGVKSPWRLLPVLGARGIAYEVLRDTARFVGRHLNPLSRLAWHRATVILAQNHETRYWLPKRHRSKAVIFPNVVLEEVPAATHSVARTAPTALFAGRLLAWKGAALAVRAMTYLPGWRLDIVGSGPDEARLRRLVRKTHLGERVVFSDPVPRYELLRRMREEADVLLFPSLHDEAGWVVVEATASGLPVLCLDVGGPPVLGGHGVRPSTPARTARALAAAAAEALAHRPRPSTAFEMESRASALVDLLVSKGLLPLPSGQAHGGLLPSEAHLPTASDSPGRD
jgi:glycosyltransferase involved in cell wall biosynthesis